MSSQNRPYVLVFETLLVLGIGCASSSGDPGTVSTDADAAASVQRGNEAVQTRNCAGCHVAADGSLSGSTTPKTGTLVYAANITPDTNTGLGSWTQAQIATVILTGVDDEGADLCKGMPRFGNSGMTQTEAQDIAAYLMSLAPVAHEIPTSVCPAS